MVVLPTNDFRSLTVRGSDHRAFLQRMVTADLLSNMPGSAIPAAALSPKAKIISVFTVCCDVSETLILIPSTHLARLLDHLERHIIADDVEIGESEAAIVSLFAFPEANQSTEGSLDSIAPWEWQHIDVAGVSATVIGDDRLGYRGWHILAPRPDISKIVEAVTRGHSLQGINPDAYKAARIEAGTPSLTYEWTSDAMLLEAGLLETVSFTKGCYPGQEPVCRVHRRGQVNRMLVGFTLSGAPANPTESVTSVNGALGLSHPAKENAGRITSWSYSPRLATHIALGYVHRKLATPDTCLSVEGGGEARVAKLPFYPTPVRARLLPRF